MSRGPTWAATTLSCRLSPPCQPATALGLPQWSIVQRGMELSDRCRFFLSSPGLRQPIGKKKTILFDSPLASFFSISSSSPQPAFAYFMLGPFQGTDNRHAERTQKPRPGGIAQASKKSSLPIRARGFQHRGPVGGLSGTAGPDASRMRCRAVQASRPGAGPSPVQPAVAGGGGGVGGVVGGGACCAIAAITCATEAVRRLA